MQGRSNKCSAFFINPATIHVVELIELAYSKDWDKIRAYSRQPDSKAFQFMTISALLSPERIFINTDISSKKRLLEFISDNIADQFDLPQNRIYNNLLDRERLGSTGLGNGFAIPHARLNDLDATIACFIRLNQPVKFEAPDNKPVDLVFAIIIPEKATDEHLEILSSLAKIFSQAETCDAIRSAGSSDEIARVIQMAEQ